MKTPLVLLLIAGTAAIAEAAATNAQHPDLIGHIFTQTGSPLSGATVFIYTAGPKVGRGTL